MRAAGFGEVSEADFWGQSSQRSQVIQAWGGSRSIPVARRPEQWTPEQWAWGIGTGLLSGSRGCGGEQGPGGQGWVWREAQPATS